MLNDNLSTSKGFHLMRILNRKYFNSEGNRLAVNSLFLEISLKISLDTN